MSNVCKKPFTISSANGTMMFTEGQTVSAEIAKMYPQFMEGYIEPKPLAHDPTLPIKLTKVQADKMSEERLNAWIRQYHGGNVPQEKMDKAALVELVLDLQQR